MPLLKPSIGSARVEFQCPVIASGCFFVPAQVTKGVSLVEPNMCVSRVPVLAPCRSNVVIPPSVPNYRDCWLVAPSYGADGVKLYGPVEAGQGLVVPGISREQGHTLAGPVAASSGAISIALSKH